jgi:hypothetical protein
MPISATQVNVSYDIDQTWPNCIPPKFFVAPATYFKVVQPCFRPKFVRKHYYLAYFWLINMKTNQINLLSFFAAFITVFLMNLAQDQKSWPPLSTVTSFSRVFCHLWTKFLI